MRIGYPLTWKLTDIIYRSPASCRQTLMHWYRTGTLRVTCLTAGIAGRDHSFVKSQTVKPENVRVIGHTGDLLADISQQKTMYIYIVTVVLNASSRTAQSCHNGCSISAVDMHNLMRNTQP